MKWIHQKDSLIFSFEGDLDNLAILNFKNDVIREIDKWKAPCVKLDFR